MHIPKTGGVSLSLILRRHYKPGEYFLTQSAQENPDESKNIILGDKETKIKAIATHLGFGFHKTINRDSKHIVMLREPVDRVISNYYHTCRVKGKMSLQEFLTNYRERAYNLQTRYLAGAEFERQRTNSYITYGECNLETLEMAKTHLKHNFYFGITENFYESVFILGKILGWNLLNCFYHTKSNISHNRLDNSENISEEDMNLIREYNSLDIELYKYARELFDKQYSCLPFLMKLELNILKFINTSYGISGRFLKSILDLIRNDE
jgi:hypothetical protein